MYNRIRTFVQVQGLFFKVAYLTGFDIIDQGLITTKYSSSLTIIQYCASAHNLIDRDSNVKLSFNAVHAP